MDEKDKKLLNDLFHQISHVISITSLDYWMYQKMKKNKEPVQISNFSTSNMNDDDKKLLVDEFNRIKYVINSHLFNERKILGLFVYRRTRIKIFK
jgi:hypothetical protein